MIIVIEGDAEIDPAKLRVVSSDDVVVHYVNRDDEQPAEPVVCNVDQDFVTRVAHSIIATRILEEYLKCTDDVASALRANLDRRVPDLQLARKHIDSLMNRLEELCDSMSLKQEG